MSSEEALVRDLKRFLSAQQEDAASVALAAFGIGSDIAARSMHFVSVPDSVDRRLCTELRVGSRLFWKQWVSVDSKFSIVVHSEWVDKEKQGT